MTGKLAETDIAIPPKVLRQVMLTIYTHKHARNVGEREAAELAEAACLAMLENWLGMRVDGDCAEEKCIILPLSQEPGA